MRNVLVCLCPKLNILFAFVSELEAEQDRLKTKMAEQQTTSPSNALEEDEKVAWNVIIMETPVI